MTNTDKKEKNSTSMKIAYGSVIGFFGAFLLAQVTELGGGLVMMLSGVLGLIAVVLGLVDKNPKAWGVGLIAPALFVFFLVVGIAMKL